MSLTIFDIKFVLSKSAAWSEIWFVVPHDFISQKLKKLQQAESLPFCPIDAAFFL